MTFHTYNNVISCCVFSIKAGSEGMSHNVIMPLAVFGDSTVITGSPCELHGIKEAVLADVAEKTFPASNNFGTVVCFSLQDCPTVGPHVTTSLFE